MTHLPLLNGRGKELLVQRIKYMHLYKFDKNKNVFKETEDNMNPSPHTQTCFISPWLPPYSYMIINSFEGRNSILSIFLLFLLPLFLVASLVRSW
jgi:hypothetical protein